MQRHKKVGGIMDRRIGENDPTMTPEERALERFVREKQKGDKKNALFNLEDIEEDGQLTHFGESLSFETPSKLDDFNEVAMSGSEDDYSDEESNDRLRKRRRLSDEASEDPERRSPPERPKTKKEVMEEVIAKSKLHKYERQQVREDDDDLRTELDKGLPDLYALMRGTPRQTPQLPKLDASQSQSASMNPDRMALLNGKDRAQADKEYDERLRQMAMEQRAQPTVRTLTEDEKLQQEAHRLKELENKRLKRMRGEPHDSESDDGTDGQVLDEYADEPPSEGDVYGLGPGLTGEEHSRGLDVEDEDDFIIDDDLIASASDIDVSQGDDREKSIDKNNYEDEEEFVADLLPRSAGQGRELVAQGAGEVSGSSHNLAYTYECPEKHEDLVQITKATAIGDLPTVVQRIRALYHPRLASENKAKLGAFSSNLVDHISYMANQPEHPPFVVLESLIRHIHSLAKTFSEEIGRAFRSHLNSMHKERPTALTAGDQIILTAIASIFPTSDHFHQVVTPAMLCMTRYLGQKIPQTLSDLAVGTYLCTLCLQYQRLSKRYVPEVVSYVLTTLWALMPGKSKRTSRASPHHNLPESLRIQTKHSTLENCENGNRLDFWDILTSGMTDTTNQSLKLALLNTHFTLILTMSTLYSTRTAYCEIFHPLHRTLQTLSSHPLPPLTLKPLQTLLRTLHITLHNHLDSRTSLRLHNHRPLAIKTSLPKFEESYNPNKHYDPDRLRAESSKLKAEHRKERKGAMRELRKDSNFQAREGLREKRERDEAYEKKFRGVVAEIQGDEGREGKSYERVKRMRRGGRR